MDTKALAWVSAGWTNPLYLAHENPRVDVEAFVGVVRKLMEGPKLCFLALGSHGHWTLLVVDRRHEPVVLRCCCTSFKKFSPNYELERTTVSFFTILNLCNIRYYDSLPNESERCRGYAEKILASLLSMGLCCLPGPIRSFKAWMSVGPISSKMRLLQPWDMGEPALDGRHRLPGDGMRGFINSAQP